MVYQCHLSNMATFVYAATANVEQQIEDWSQYGQMALG